MRACWAKKQKGFGQSPEENVFESLCAVSRGETRAVNTVRVWKPMAKCTSKCLGEGQGDRRGVPGQGAAGWALKHPDTFVALPDLMGNWGSHACSYFLLWVYWEPTSHSTLYEPMGAVLRPAKT